MECGGWRIDHEQAGAANGAAFQFENIGQDGPPNELTGRARFGSSEHALPLQLHLYRRFA